VHSADSLKRLRWGAVPTDDTSTQIGLLLVPGGGGSGPDHWHTYWEAEDARAERVVQADWEHGSCADWVATLNRHIQAADTPVVLAAHSLGTITVGHWAAAHSGPVLGALLVAPADIDDEWVKSGSLYEDFRPIPGDRRSRT
jgi:predicted alpha/beta hydrolase family esterase